MFAAQFLDTVSACPCFLRHAENVLLGGGALQGFNSRAPTNGGLSVLQQATANVVVQRQRNARQNVRTQVIYSKHYCGGKNSTHGCHFERQPHGHRDVSFQLCRLLEMVEREQSRERESAAESRMKDRRHLPSILYCKNSAVL